MNIEEIDTKGEFMNWIYITLIVIASLIGVILIYSLVQIVFDEIKKGYFKKE